MWVGWVVGWLVWVGWVVGGLVGWMVGCLCVCVIARPSCVRPVTEVEVMVCVGSRAYTLRSLPNVRLVSIPVRLVTPRRSAVTCV